MPLCLPIPDVWGCQNALMESAQMLAWTQSDSTVYAAAVEAVLTPMLGLDVSAPPSKPRCRSTRRGPVSKYSSIVNRSPRTAACNGDL